MSILALLGHAIDLPILTSLLAGQQQMVISTALGILMASLALMAQQVSEHAAARIALNTSALLLIAVGLIALLEFQLEADWLDFNALHKHSLKVNPERMAFMTAICFVLLGSAMLASSINRFNKLFYFGLACVTLLGLLTTLSLLSFAANFEFLSSFGRSNRMALPTALSFLALAFGAE